VAHPGLGGYYNARWGDFFERCPQKKSWLGFIPLYGWPGDLQVLSAIDAYHGRTSDDLTPVSGGSRRASATDRGGTGRRRLASEGVEPEMPDASSTTLAPPRRFARLPVGRLLAAVAGIAALAALGRAVGGRLPAFAAWVDGLGVWGPVVFVLGYALAVVAFVPGSVLTLAAGAIFGLAEGVAVVFLAATLGASAAFLLARHAARGAVERRLAGSPRFAAIDRAVEVEGRRIVLLLRLSPVFPFTLLNYALGLTRVRFADYLVASLGMLPGTILYVYSGKVAGDVAALAGGAGAARGAGHWAVLGVGLVASVLATTLVTRTARRALREATGE
jgi:uncharacterized membrane protein YdjX (TVP38/TMEM64 family)